MGCFGGDREKQAPKEHRWEYFNLSDFKSNSCWAPFSYGILYITLIISVACYVLDILTCSQLLVFDKWSGQVAVSPIIPFEIARWIFTGCILLSFVFLGYRWWRAIRAIKTGSVVASYLDPLAVRVQSIRLGQAQGWRRFLVFTELTKQKKGAEYVALFSHFSFEAALRIIFAEGPRQVINGMTIYTIMTSEIIPINGGKTATQPGHSPVVQFFLNVKALAEGNNLRAAVFFGMVFTLIIWVIAALSLLVACILYLVFLWHHIPAADGGLRGYCKRKVDGKLQSIVDKKIQKALDREDKMRLKQEAKAAKTGQPIPGIKKQPTLPVFMSGDDKLPDMPTMSRATTSTTLPEYESRPGTAQAGSSDFARPGMPSRTGTQASDASYGSNAPLMGAASGMGYSEPRSFTPTQRYNSPAPSSMTGPPGPPVRSLTGDTLGSQGSYGYGQRPPMGPSRQNTGTSSQFSAPDRNFTPAPSMRSNTPMSSSQFAPGPPRRQNTGMSDGGYFAGVDRADTASVTSAQSRRPGPPGARSVSEQPIEMQNRSQSPAFRPYSPALSSGSGPRLPFAGPNPAQRNFTSPAGVQSSSDSFDRSYGPPRSGTAPPQNYRPMDVRPGPPARSATAGPGYDQWPQHGL